MNKLLAYIYNTTDFENIRSYLNLLESNEKARVLDCGCAHGGLTKQFGERIGTAELYGIEIEEELAGQAEKRGIKVYHADLNNPLPVDNEFFDVVLAIQVIEHLHRTDNFIREIHRVLKPGGYTIIATPNRAAWHTIFLLILGMQHCSEVSDEVFLGNPFTDARYRSKRNPESPQHLRTFTYNALRELFQYYGFRVEKTIGVGYYPFPGRMSRIFSSIDPRHSVCLTIKARKV